jgi:thiol:disulfide interchange protein DsbA
MSATALSDMNNLFRSLALSLSLVAGFAHALAAEPVAGKNYEVLKLPQPTSAPPGKVEVIEFFYYSSQNCYKLEPILEAFVKKEGDRILLKRVPFLAFQFEHHTKLYYSLVSLGLEEKLRLAVYNEIQNKTPMFSEEVQADFLATQGVDKMKFLVAYNSVDVDRRVLQASELAFNDLIEVGPTLVVAGRYKIRPRYNGLEGMATVLDYLVKQVLDKKP